MLPSIWPGDVLLIRRADPANMELGDLVLYAREKSFVVHRIVRKYGDRLVTRGDALCVDDEPVPFSVVLGKVAMIERRGAQLIPKNKLQGPAEFLSLLVRHFDMLKGLALRLNSLRLKLDRAGISRETGAA